MPAFGHTWCDWLTKTDRARRVLGDWRCKNLLDIVPVEVNICVKGLGVVVLVGIDYEAIIRVYISEAISV